MFPFGFGGWGGNMFPYTNFHDMNLDWIIWQVKHNKDSIEQFSEQLTQMGVDIEEFREYIENIDSEIQQEVQTQVPIAIEHEIQTGGFNTILTQSHKKRIVCIGDSYGLGWTPDGYFPNWIDKFKYKLGIANTDFVSASMGGAGFGREPSDGRLYVPTLIEEAGQNITNPDTVTDVIIAMGYNDINFVNNTSRITNGINASITKIRTLFPTAIIHVYAIGFCTNLENQLKLKTIYNIYASYTHYYQYCNLSNSLINTAHFVSDGIHPNESGQEVIAKKIMSAFTFSTYYPDNIARPISDTTFTLVLGGEKTVNGLLFFAQKEDKAVLACPRTIWPVTLLAPANIVGGSWVKLAKISSNTLTGYTLPNNYINAPAQLAYKTSASPDTFNTLPIVVSLAPDPDNNDYNNYLWIMLPHSSASGFTTIYNMTTFAIMGLNLEIPFITK